MKVPLFFIYFHESNLRILVFLLIIFLMNAYFSVRTGFFKTIKVLFQVSCSRKPIWCKMIFCSNLLYICWQQNQTTWKPPSHFLLLFNISLLCFAETKLTGSLLQNSCRKVALQTLLYLMLQAILFSNIQQMKTDYTKYNFLLLLFLLRLSCCFKTVQSKLSHQLQKITQKFWQRKIQ
jgi:hypothetical protein